MSNKRRHWVGQDGLALLEVLFASLVLGIAVIGISLMMTRAQTAVVAQGDRYASMYLAQQRIEAVVAASLVAPPAGFGTVALGTTAEPGLQSGDQYGTSLTTQTFARTTCVDRVPDGDPTTATTASCTNCALGGACTGNTKRITVTVTPDLVASDPVTLTAVITAHP